MSHQCPAEELLTSFKKPWKQTNKQKEALELASSRVPPCKHEPLSSNPSPTKKQRSCKAEVELSSKASAFLACTMPSV
jgi:hypothetical protein